MNDVQLSVQERLKNEDKEREIISAIVNSKEYQIQVATELKDHYLTCSKRIAIFNYAKEIMSNNRSVNKQSLEDHIKLRAPSRDVKYIIEEISNCCSLPLTDDPVNNIAHLAELRKNRVIYYDILVEGNRMFLQSDSVEEIISKFTSSLISIETGRKEVETKEVVDNVIDSILNPGKKEKGLSTGLDQFDMQYGGVMRDRYYTIGAESGTGKTATIADMIHRVCNRHQKKVKILFFSMEMSEDRIVQRLISRYTGLTNQTLEQKLKLLTKDQRQKASEAAEKVRNYPLEIVYDTMNTDQMEMRAKKFIAQNPDVHPIIMLDHIGLVVGKTNDMRVNTIQASSTMKKFCTNYKASVFVLTQFTKEIDSKENAKNYHKPHMGYIMESGRIRQDSDGVILLWRPETRFNTISYAGDDEWSTENKMIWLNEKNRDGQAPTHMIFGCNIGSNVIENLKDPFSI
jgi:replicative DNA helicase